MKITDYPAAVLYAINTAVALAVSFCLGLSGGQVSAITVISTAVLTGLAALLTRPIPIAAFGAAASRLSSRSPRSDTTSTQTRSATSSQRSPSFSGS